MNAAPKPVIEVINGVELVNREWVAQFVNRTRKTVSNWSRETRLADGTVLPPRLLEIRVGGQVRYRKSDVENLVATTEDPS
jgi:hypothetical protein